MTNLYRHFKGGLYIFLGYARHSETKEEMVVYITVPTKEVWVRPKALWEEIVRWPDGQMRPRFIADGSYTGEAS